MFYWSIMFLIVAIVAGLLGFTNVAGAAIGMAKIIFFTAIILWGVVIVAFSSFLKK